jgi:hypothetical protein
MHLALHHAITVLAHTCALLPLQDGVHPSHVLGGSRVETCGWPTTVGLDDRCSGTLIHPSLVVYAAHCGANVNEVYFGADLARPERVARTRRCAVRPGGGPGNGRDIAFCVLDTPQLDIPIVPPIGGCELDVLERGREVVVVGFGITDSGESGVKHEARTLIVDFNESGEIFLYSEGVDTCTGDSGGPAFVELSVDDGYDGSWRLLAITSYGTNEACGSGGYYSPVLDSLDWIESESGLDVSPCYGTGGHWEPSAKCADFPRAPSASVGEWSAGCRGPTTGYGSLCGAAFDPVPTGTGPQLRFAEPSEDVRISADVGRLPVELSASAADGSGVAVVQLIIDGHPATEFLREVEPYRFLVELTAEKHVIGARATDYHGRETQVGDIRIMVEEDTSTACGVGARPRSGSTYTIWIVLALWVGRGARRHAATFDMPSKSTVRRSGTMYRPA